MSEVDLERKLALIAKLLAFSITQDEKSRAKKIFKLHNYGLKPKEIAEIFEIETWRVNNEIKRQNKNE